MNLPEFSVKHSFLGFMMTIFVLVGGLLLAYTMQRDTFPEIELDMVIITTVYPNASPEEIEDLITNPIEEEIRDVEGIEEFSSSSVEGISAITVTIDEEARFKERVINEIQRKVDQVRDLPAEAEEPDVQTVSAESPVMRVCIYGDASERAMRKYGDYLKEKLKQVPGVSTVSKSGWRDEEFWVEVDIDALESQELAFTDVAQALARRNINRPGGKLTTGSKEVVVRTIGQFHSESEIADVIVRSNSDGNHVRVRDVATVTRAFEEGSAFNKVNGDRSLILGVKRKRSGDTIYIADQLKLLLAAEQEMAPEGMKLTYLDDESFYVKRRLRVLSSNGIIGMIFVIATLFMFLNFRVAMVTGIGIPFALLATLMIMSAFGITINLITMFGLIIVLGMLVDDAIIVGENIFRHLEEGMLPRDAAIQGTTEVMYPVISTVLTTIAAFGPLVFAPDVMGQVLRWFPIVITITLLASLFEVLFIMPSHVADFVKPLRKEETVHSGDGSGHVWMRRIQRFYTKAIKWALKMRYLFLASLLAVFIILFLTVRALVTVDIFPADLIDIFVVRVTSAEGTPLSETEAIMDRVESEIQRLPDDELENISSYIGGQLALEGGFKSRGSHYASAFVYLTPQNTRARKTQTIIDELREQCAALSGVEKLEFELVEPGPPTGKPLEVKVRGADLEVLETISGEIMAFLHSQQGVFDIQQDYERGKDEVHIEVDHEEAARLGLDVFLIAQTVNAAFQGAEPTIVREGNEEIKVRTWLQEPYRDDVASLERLQVRNKSGRLIPLSRVATFTRAAGLPAIFHYDGDRVITVSAIMGEGVSAVKVNQKLEAAFEDVPSRYPGYDLIRGGEWKETRKLMLFMLEALGIAMLLIFVVLAVQFESLFQPFVVMASIPLGMAGVMLALIAHNMPVSIMAMMGMVGLAGVVVNDAIVLVKFINDRRRIHGVPLYDAIVDAGQKRLRPILLTSVTTIAGLMPVIYGWGGYEPFVAPAAVALAYGLLFATVLTLLVVPAIYHVAYDIKRGMGKLGEWILQTVGKTRRSEGDV